MLAEITLILATLHSQGGFNNTNPGVLLHLDEVGGICQPTLGGYYNSERRMSYLVGCKATFGNRDGLHASITGGLLTGYAAGRVLPFAIPSVSYGGLNVSLLPPPSWVGQKSDVVGANVSYTITWK